MTLREVLLSRAERRQSNGERERELLIAGLRAGDAVIVPAYALAAALWEAGLVNAREREAVLTGAPRYVVTPDGSYEALI